MSDASRGDVTQLLSAVQEGGTQAMEQLIELVYAELHQLAQHRLAREARYGTMQTTALVHEVYLRLFAGAEVHWQNRAHFFSAAAEAMRRILVDRARRAHRIKRGGDRQRAELDEACLPNPEDSGADLLALDEALDKLRRHSERKYEVVMLRYFVGLSLEETAEVLQSSAATVSRDWTYSRAWLHREIAAAD